MKKKESRSIVMPKQSLEIEIVLLKIANCFDSHSIPYMVVGTQAILRYGEPRLKKDIDISLGIGVNDLDKALNAIRKCKLRLLVKTPEKFVRETHILPTEDIQTGIRVSLNFTSTSFERSAIQRAIDVSIGDKFIKFAAVEDVIIQKIISGRPGDIEDIISILVRKPRLNTNYIIKWLKIFEPILNFSLVPIFKNLQRKVLAKELSFRK